MSSSSSGLTLGINPIFCLKKHGWCAQNINPSLFCPQLLFLLLTGLWMSFALQTHIFYVIIFINAEQMNKDREHTTQKGVRDRRDKERWLTVVDKVLEALNPYNSLV